MFLIIYMIYLDKVRRNRNELLVLWIYLQEYMTILFLQHPEKRIFTNNLNNKQFKVKHIKDIFTISTPWWSFPNIEFISMKARYVVIL